MFQFKYVLLFLFSSIFLLFLFIFSIFFFSPLPFPDMDSTPYAEAASLVELLNSQEDSVFRLVDGSLEPSSSQFPLFGSQAVSSPFSDASSFGVEKGTERKERRA